MRNGFLDNLPDVELPEGRGKRRHARKQPAAKAEAMPSGEHKVVIWHKIQCPKCGSKNIKTHTTRRPIRYHKCRNCGRLFKSVEQ